MSLRLTQEERLWRYNFLIRIAYGVIPLRNRFDKTALQTSEQLWNAGTMKDQENDQAPFSFRAFDEKTGLFFVKGSFASKKEQSVTKKIIERMRNTQLPAPPTTKAIPRRTVTQHEYDAFIQQCPQYLLPYAEFLVIVKNDRTTALRSA